MSSSYPGSHSVHFYEPTLFPSKHIAEFVHKGILENESIVLVASEDHAVRIERESRRLEFMSEVCDLRACGLS